MSAAERKPVDVLADLDELIAVNRIAVRGDSERSLIAIRTAMAELIEHNRWIPVTEALPDDPDEEVIVWRLYDAARTGWEFEKWQADTSSWDGEEWLFGVMTDYVQVSHWRRMPLGPVAALARVQGGVS